MYRAARHVLSSASYLPATPTYIGTPLVSPGSAGHSVAVASGGGGVNTSGDRELTPSHQQQAVKTYGSNKKIDRNSKEVTPQSSTSATVGNIAVRGKSPEVNPNDPLAGIGDFDPMFDFAQALANNINTVIAKEDEVRQEVGWN